ncbi:MAG: DUF2752 domain-containing protein [Lachnospiraceae bacterium]|nr:DUF2752 domain-containing protein [Lachnospiraceae bacterium]
MEKRTTEELLYKTGAWALVLGLPFFLLYTRIKDLIFPVPCAFEAMFGLYCPGCGGTRAVNALLHGKILLSLWYHPLVLYAAVIYICFMGSHFMEKRKIWNVRGLKFRDWYLYGALIILIANFVLKNALRVCCGILL